MPNRSSDGPGPTDRDGEPREGNRRVAGLDEPLPSGETVLWEGRPDRTALARHLLHGRVVLAYFVVLAAWTAIEGASGGMATATWAGDAGLYLAAGVGVLAFFHLIAEVIRRHSRYLLTDRRLLLNVGFAFPKVINLPLERIESASLRTRRDGTGLVAVRPAEGLGLGYALLWPHARPWRLRRPEPALRGLADPERVGELVADALRETADREQPKAASGASGSGSEPAEHNEEAARAVTAGGAVS